MLFRSVPEEELDGMIRAVENVLDEINAASIPRILVLNKSDRLDPDQENFLRRTYPEAVLVSALKRDGLEGLQQRIKAFFDSSLVSVELFFPYGDGRAIGEIYKSGSDVELENTPEGVIVRARLPREEAARLSKHSL